MSLKSKELDQIISENKNKAIIELNSIQFSNNRAFMKSTHTGLYEYCDRYFQQRKN